MVFIPSRASRIQIIDHDGTARTVVGRIKRVVGPASYAAGGFQVDMSDVFSRIVAAQALRRFTTATGAIDAARIPAVGEAGTDTYANAKFRGISLIQANHTHTYDKANTPTDATLDTAPAGAGTTHTHALAYTSTASGSVSNKSMAELDVGQNESTMTFEFMVWGVPL